MELDNTIQVPSENLQKQYFDAFIAVSGYESRCCYLANKVNTSEIPIKIAIAYNELCESINRTYNDQRYLDLGFSFFHVSSREASALQEIFNLIFRKRDQKIFNILVDYSSMSKTWYNAILNYFSDLEDDYDKVNLWFCYSPSEYTRSLQNGSDGVPDVPEMFNNKPVALILGLGYETGLSQDLARKLNAEVTYAFYADPAYDDRYVKEVLENNNNLLKSISNKQIVRYPMYDLNSINASLTQLCINLRLTHQIIIVPVGPKPFSLMSFILASRYPDIKLWRVSTLGSMVAAERKPYGELLLYKVEFTSEEVDY